MIFSLLSVVELCTTVRRINKFFGRAFGHVEASVFGAMRTLNGYYTPSYLGPFVITFDAPHVHVPADRFRTFDGASETYGLWTTQCRERSRFGATLQRTGWRVERHAAGVEHRRRPLHPREYAHVESEVEWILCIRAKTETGA